tara:strand:+ start:392 stop:667 length:276 start_codon:yes stop_codon:yes gene_type:complete
MTNKKLITLPRFNDVEPKSLQAWNRCNVFFNICSDLGRDLGKQYVEEFSGKERASMIMMFTLIKTKGYEQIKKEVNKNVVGEGDKVVKEAF